MRAAQDPAAYSALFGGDMNALADSPDAAADGRGPCLLACVRALAGSRYDVYFPGHMSSAPGRSRPQGANGQRGVTLTLPLERINEGFDPMKRGESIRSVVPY